MKKNLNTILAALITTFVLMNSYTYAQDNGSTEELGFFGDVSIRIYCAFSNFIPGSDNSACSTNIFVKDTGSTYTNATPGATTTTVDANKLVQVNNAINRGLQQGLNTRSNVVYVQGPAGPAGRDGTTTIIYQTTIAGAAQAGPAAYIYAGGNTNTNPYQTTVPGDIHSTYIHHLTMEDLYGGLANITYINASTTNTSNLTFYNATGSNLIATGTITTLNLVGTNATLTNASSTNLFSVYASFTEATTTNLFSIMANIWDLYFNNATGTNIQLANATTTYFAATGTAFLNEAYVSSSTQTNSSILSGNATLTTAVVGNATSTNLFATSASFTGATATDLFANRASITEATTTYFFAAWATFLNLFVENLTFKNATGTNLQVANASTTNFSATGTSVITNLFGTLATFTEATTTNLFANSSVLNTAEIKAGNATLTTLVSGNSTSTNTFATNASITNATTTNLFAALFRALNATIDQLAFTNATGSTLQLGSLFTTNINATGTATITNAIVTNATITNATVTKIFGTNASITNATTTNIFSNRASITNGTSTNWFSLFETVTNLFATRATITNATVTNISANTISGDGTNALTIGTFSNDNVNFVTDGNVVMTMQPAAPGSYEVIIPGTSDFFVGDEATANTMYASTTFASTTNAINAIFTTLRSTGSTSLASTTAQGRLIAGSIISTTTLSVFGTSTLATTTIASGTINTLNAGNIVANNGTFTNATVTKIFATNASITNATTTNLFTALFNALSATFTNLIASNATLTNATSSNIVTGNLNATGTATITNAIVTNAVVTRATITSGTSTDWFTTNEKALNATISFATLTNATSTNLFTTILNALSATFTNLIASNATISNATSTNIFSLNGNFGVLRAGPSFFGTVETGLLNASTTNSSTTNALNLLATNSTLTSATSTNLFATLFGALNATIDQLLFTNATGSTLQLGSLFTTNINATGTATITNAVIASSTLASTTLTMATIYGGNANLDNFSANNATSTNLSIVNLGTSLGNATITVNASLVPSASSTFDLGSALLPWRDLWVSSSTVHIGGNALSASGTSILWNGAPIAVASTTGPTSFGTVTASTTLSDNLSATNAIIGSSTIVNLNSTNIFTQFLTTLNSYIENLTFLNAVGGSLQAANIVATDLTATGTAAVVTLNASTSNIENLNATDASFSGLTSRFNTLYQIFGGDIMSTSTINANNIFANGSTVLANLNATTTNTDGLIALNATITNATLTNATFTKIYADVITTDVVEYLGILGTNATITNATITNALATKFSAGDITTNGLIINGTMVVNGSLQLATTDSSVNDFGTGDYTHNNFGNGVEVMNVFGSDTGTNMLKGYNVADNLFSANATITNATITNATSTNLFTTLFSAANATIDDLISTIITAGTVNTLVLNATTTNTEELNVSGDSNLGNINITGNIIPTADITYDLGSASNRWRDLWISGNTIHMGSSTLSMSSGTLIVNGSPIITSSSSFSVATSAPVFTITTATLTNATSTNIFADFFRAMNASIDILVVNNLTATSANIVSASITNATLTNATSTNLFVTLLNATTASIANLFATNATLTNATVTNLAVRNINATGTFALATGTVASTTINTANIANIFAGLASTSNLMASNATVSNMRVDSVINRSMTFATAASGTLSNLDGISVLNVNATTSGVVLSLATPTQVTASHTGRVMYVNNVGTTTFTMYGSAIAPDTGRTIVWTGTKWSMGVDGVGSTGTTTISAHYLDLNSTLNTNSTNFSLITDLSYNVAANETWYYVINGVLTGGDGNNNGMAVQITVPSGSSKCSTHFQNTTLGYSSASTTCGAALSSLTTENWSSPDTFKVEGMFTTGGTSGSVRFNWAKNSNGGGSLTLATSSTILTAYKMTGADLAEVYYSNEAIIPGEIVTLTEEGVSQVTRSTVANDTKALGIVSTKPGTIIGQADGTGYPVVVGLSGRVPVKVTAKNGAIKVGDYITTSDIAGVGMRASKEGRVLGKALTTFNGTGDEVGMVYVFIQNTYYEGDADEGLAERITLATGAIADKFTNNIKKSLENLSNVMLSMTLWVSELKASTVTADRTVVKELCVGGECFTETDMKEFRNYLNEKKNQSIENPTNTESTPTANDTPTTEESSTTPTNTESEEETVTETTTPEAPSTEGQPMENTNTGTQNQ